MQHLKNLGWDLAFIVLILTASGQFSDPAVWLALWIAMFAAVLFTLHDVWLVWRWVNGRL